MRCVCDGGGVYRGVGVYLLFTYLFKHGEEFLTQRGKIMPLRPNRLEIILQIADDL